jgi:hypothetical protein
MEHFDAIFVFQGVNMTSLEGPILLSNPPWILVRLSKRKYW